MTSYYSYLPALFIYKDLKFHFLEKSKINFKAKHQFWPETAPNGNKVIKTTIGMSVLYFPFFIKDGECSMKNTYLPTIKVASETLYITKNQCNSKAMVILT